MGSRVIVPMLILATALELPTRRNSAMSALVSSASNRNKMIGLDYIFFLRRNDVLKAENAGCIGSGELSLALSMVMLIEPEVSSELRTEIEEVEAPRGLGGSYLSASKVES